MESRRQLDSAGGAGIATRLIFVFVVLTSAAAAQADADYNSGLALAQLGHFDAARAVLLRGLRLEPRDERFPIELGGVAFKQKRYAEAAGWLRRALRLNPSDAYAADFLATVYFLQGNLDAALKYWNRIDKPRIASVHVDPGLRTDPVLLDRAFAFAPGAALLLPDLLTTRARVEGLGTFSSPAIGLNARPDGQFDSAFTARERNGWGKLSSLRGLAWQTIYPEYFNVAGSAINITSLVRWDPQKRRLAAAVSGPLGGDPRYRYQAGLDLRDENWDLPAGPVKLRKRAISGTVTCFPSATWSWSTGAEFAYRGAWQLKHLARLDRALWRLPERRFESSLHFSSETGRIWSTPAHPFERLQVSLTARWQQFSQQFRAGKIFGQVPFDELYMLGLERDNDLLMRAHIGTRDGRKGSAPLVRNYFLSNWEMDKNVYSGLFTLKLSPFLDTGKSTSTKWLYDTGVQAKISALGLGFVVVYGKDLRSGKNAFYLMATR